MSVNNAVSVAVEAMAAQLAGKVKAAAGVALVEGVLLAPEALGLPLFDEGEPPPGVHPVRASAAATPRPTKAADRASIGGLRS
jgi:hypothetical protein